MSGNTNNTVFLQRLFSSRDNFVSGNVQEATSNTANFVGQAGRIWWDPTRNNFYASDGNTPGGILIGGASGNGTVFGSNTWVQYNNNGNFGGSPNFTFNSSTNVLSATYFSGDGSNLTNVNLTGVAAGNTTEIQFNTAGDFSASGNLRFDAGSNTLFTDQVAIPTGTMLSGNAAIVYVIATLTLDQILANSNGTLDALPAGSYGNPNEVPAPWSVFQFTTTPSPGLEENDVLSGAGVPAPSNVVYVGTGGNSNIVVTSSTFFGLPTPIPSFGTLIPVARETLNAGLAVSTSANTDIVLTPGPGGGIIWAGDLVPLTDDEFTIGSPTRRIKQAYFGGNTIFIYDTYLGIDQNIGANNGNLIVSGGTGLTVGNFIMSGNTLFLDNPSAEFNIGTPGAPGNLNINRPMTVSDSTGDTVFSVTSDGRVEIEVGSQPANSPGALNLIGSPDGSYQPVQFPGGMLHITSNQNQPARFTSDGFGAGAFAQFTGRAGRGTAAAPTALQTNDSMMRLTAVGWGATRFPTTPAPTGIEFVATENYTDSAYGSKINIYTAPNGTATKQLSAAIDHTGLLFTGNTEAGVGITFRDGTRQITAFNDTSAVTSVTVGVGLSQTTTVGDVGIDATGVQSVTGTANRVIVTDLGGQNFNLSTPQDLNTSSTLTFANLTITGNLTVNGTTTTANSANLDSKVLYLAANSTSNSQISQGGIVLGNNSSSYKVSILYDLPNNQWTTGTTGLTTGNLIANTANIDFLNVQNGGHFGLINEQLDYPNAYVQIDSNVNSYSQIVSQNHSPGTSASTDLVLVNDIGDDGNHYIDMGINGSNYTDPAFSSTLANDGYLFVNQGNLVIGTTTAAKTIKFVAGDTTSTDIIATISNTGISTSGNVTATYFVGNGSKLTNITGANVTGTVANATYAVTSGSVTNSLTVNNSGTGASSGATFNGGSAVTISYNTVGAPKADGTGASGTWGISITGNANVANTANAVAGANVSGQVGNALVAGTVYTNAQPNITSVGTLTGLTSNGVVNFSNTSNVTLGAVANLHITGGSANNILLTNGSGNLSWASVSTVNGVGGNQLVFVLNAQRSIGNAKNTLLSLFGLTNGVTLATNTRYQYEILFNAQCSKAGTLSYALALGGSAAVAQHNYIVTSNKTTAIDTPGAGVTMMSQNATGAAITTAQTVADTATFTHTTIQGTIDVTTGGNVNFMVSQDQNTPVTWTINAGSYVRLMPLGAIGANTAAGTWS